MKKILLFLILIPISIRAETSKLAENSKSVIMIEATTGEVIFKKNENKILPPASMTKIMTMLLVVEAIEDGQVKWDEMVNITEEAANMGGSQILLETGESMSVEDLFKGVAIASGNDAAVALAILVGGTVDNFVDMMNKRAEELGLKNTKFKNPHGLDDPNHYSTAKDMSIMSKELVKHKKVLEFTKIYDTYLREGKPTKIWLVNTNKLVKFYDGVDGLKTGYTKQAGYCLTSTAKKNNMRLITVVMGTESTSIRNKETTDLLNYGFSQYKIDTYLSQNKKIGKINIINGKQDHSNLVPLNDISFLENKTNNTNKKLKYKIKIKSIKAPVKPGDKVGHIEIFEDGKVIRKEYITVDKENKKANIIELYLKNIKKALQP